MKKAWAAQTAQASLETASPGGPLFHFDILGIGVAVKPRRARHKAFFMSDPNQQSLALIPHDYQGELISLRAGDGYVNATAMCKAAGKEFKHYNENRTTKAFLAELSREVGIPTAELIQSLSGGLPQLQGTWVHPQVAIHLAQWASPKFAVQVTAWVIDWMTGLDPRDRVWQQFEDRVSLVNNSVPDGYFCIFNEIGAMFATLIIGGANFGTRMILDLSVGLHWARHWKDNGVASRFGARAKFDHNFPRYFPQSYSNPQKANCYPDAALPEFRRWLRDDYMKSHLPTYLRDQVRQGKLPTAVATNTMDALEHHQRTRRTAVLG